MTPEDRELLQSLRRQQHDLQRSLARLDAQLEQLEARAGIDLPVEAPAEPPSLPVDHTKVETITLGPVPTFLVQTDPVTAPKEEENLPPVPLPPMPSHAPEPLPAPQLFPPTPPPPPAPSFEFNLGRWFLGLSAVLGVIFLGLLFTYTHGYIFRLLGPSGLLGVAAAAGFGGVAIGEWLLKRDGARRIAGHTLSAMSLAWLYLTAYAAHALPAVKVIDSPLAALALLLAWSVYVLLVAERRQSQALAIFAVTLAYLSIGLHPLGKFAMLATLGLAFTGVAFQVRRGWAVLSYFGLIGTYLVYLRRLVLDEHGGLVLDTSRMLHFTPHATYLFGAWVLFTAAVIFCSATDFRGGKRFAFLSLNNGAFTGLLVLTAHISGHGQDAMGGSLLAAGALLLIASRLVGWTLIEPERVMTAYASQGLGVFTAGVIVYFTGVTRGFLLALETFFLGAAATFSGDRVLKITTYFAAFFATIFLLLEIAVYGHHPWLLGFGGALVMLVNAWWARNDYRLSPYSRRTVVLSSSYYCALALGLIYGGLCIALSEAALPPALAFSALALTLVIYLVELYELPPLAQLLLLVAQYLVLWPEENGEPLPHWTTFWVAVVTLGLLTWWTRQTVTRKGTWIYLLSVAYALALAAMTAQHIGAGATDYRWMIDASLLSVAFLVWGVFTRVWTIALVSQLFLIDAVYLFFTLQPEWTSSWSWISYILPMVVVYATARATHRWLQQFPETPEFLSSTLNATAYLYQVLALGMLARCVFLLAGPHDQTSVFLLLGTLIVTLNLRPADGFGIRCGIIFSLLGLIVYLGHLPNDVLVYATVLNALAFLAFLAQPLLLERAETRENLTEVEHWALVFLTIGAGWLFISEWVDLRIARAYLTLGWAGWGFFIFLVSLMTGSQRFRLCGLGILLAAIIRVFAYDFWGLSNGYKVLTFLMLTCITFAVGYLILRRTHAAKAASATPPPFIPPGSSQPPPFIPPPTPPSEAPPGSS